MILSLFLLWNISNIQRRAYVQMSNIWQTWQYRTVAVNFIDLVVESFFQMALYAESHYIKYHSFLGWSGSGGFGASLDKPFSFPSPPRRSLRCAHRAWRPREGSWKPHLEYVQDPESKLNTVLFNQNRWHNAQMFEPIRLVHNGACKTLIQISVLLFWSQF